MWTNDDEKLCSALCLGDTGYGQAQPPASKGYGDTHPCTRVHSHHLFCFSQDFQGLGAWEHVLADEHNPVHHLFLFTRLPLRAATGHSRGHEKAKCL